MLSLLLLLALGQEPQPQIAANVEITANLIANNTVVLPAGEYHIYAPIVVPNGTTLRGSLANNAPIGTTIINHGDGPAILIPGEARFGTIERLRILGLAKSTAGIATQPFASNYVIRDVYSSGHLDGITVGSGNFLVRLENVFSDANARHGFDIGAEVGWGSTGTTITLTTCFARWNKSWGMIFRNQWGLTVIGSASDANGDGGMFFRHTAGTVISPTTESNPLGFWFYYARMTVISPTVDCIAGSPCTIEQNRYKREGGSVNIINSELNWR